LPELFVFHDCRRELQPKRARTATWLKRQLVGLATTPQNRRAATLGNENLCGPKEELSCSRCWAAGEKSVLTSIGKFLAATEPGFQSPISFAVKLL